jgi:DNA-binding NarL/FixJ family response regulator
VGKTKILIADTQSIVRLGLRSLLRTASSYIVVGEADNPRTATQLAGKHNPHIVILDLQSPSRNHIQILRTLKRASPVSRVLVYSNDGSEDSFFKAFHAGADGYLLKNTDPAFILDALKTLKDGGQFFGPNVSDVMLKHFLATGTHTRRKRSALPGNLTQRETEVLTHIALGLTNQEIASRLYISPLTVHTHRTNLLKKLKAHGTAQLVRFAIEHGLVGRLE